MRTILLFLLCLLLIGCEKAETDTPPIPPPPTPTLITMNVTVKTPGTLLSLLNGQEKLIENLTIKGEINGTDIRLIRYMAGSGLLANRPTEDYHLSTLDLSDATIVEGGDFYFGIEGYPDCMIFTIKNEFPALVYCLNLKSITLPNSITSIGENAFDTCIGITSITIPNNVTSIGAYAFCGTRIVSMTIPEKITSIGTGAFVRSGLMTMVIPDNVTYIGKNAFASCDMLSSVTIGTGITSLEDGTFRYCPRLKYIYMKSANPPVIIGEDSCVFDDDIIYYKAILFVPKGSKAKYEAAPMWSKFNIIVETNFE